MADFWYSIGGRRAAIRGKFISIQNDAGDELLRIGRSADGRPGQILARNELDDDDASLAIGEIRLDSDPNHAAVGLIINERFSGDQKDVFRVTDHGWEAPEWSVPLVGLHMAYSTTSTSYVIPWRQACRVLCRTLWVSWRLLPDTSQTVTLRGRISVDDGATYETLFEQIAYDTVNFSEEIPMPPSVDLGDFAILEFSVKVSGGTGQAYPRFGPYWIGGGYVGRSSAS